MQAIATPEPIKAASLGAPCTIVTLSNGEDVDVTKLSVQQLVKLQCEEEPKFASAIVASRKGSPEREQITEQAYTALCAILEELQTRADADSSFSMGMDRRYSDLILRLLARQAKRGVHGGLFEVGFSSGVLLDCVSKQGFEVGGVEVVEDLVNQAKRKLSAEHHPRLLHGDFRKLDLGDHLGRYSLVYWNDVFEHIPQDEILDYLRVIYSLLCDGGQLVTITPNWHMRPSDVTNYFSPPRTEAVGFHLKEYTAGEVCGLVREAGFRSVRTPSFITRGKIYAPQLGHFTRIKLAVEPLLERLPFVFAVQACRRLGLNCTIATK